MVALNEIPGSAGQGAQRGLTSSLHTAINQPAKSTVTLKLVDAAPGPAQDAEEAAALALTAQIAQRAARDEQLAGLLQRAAKRDQQAFAPFYDATVGYAQALARRMVSAADLEDVLAEAYLEVWRKAGSFDAARGSAVTWLLLIVRSRTLDLLRKPREEALDEDTLDVPADDAGPPDLLETTQANAALHAALAQLGAKERWALSLAYYRDMSHAQIAAHTGMPLGTVKSLINRAQEKLRTLLHA
ncbi:MAG: RNA polymerase sigma factor [Burkholderiaceae bacterium]